VNLQLFFAISGGIGWLMYDAHQRRVTGRPFTPLYRTLLWTSATLSGLFTFGAGALAVLGLHDRNGMGPLATLVFGPLSLGGAAATFALVWYARYRFPDASTPR